MASLLHRAHEKRPYTIFVEGNIGVGKTTYTQHLRYSFTAVEVIPEPTHLWVDEEGRSYLDLFYENPVAYGYRTQRKILDTFYQAHVQPASP